MDISERGINIQIALFFEENADIPIVKFAGSLQDEYRVMFEKEPQIIPLPPEAPKEAPRCIFEKEGGAARLTFSLSRIDFFASLKDGKGWKNYIEVIIYTLLKVCEKFSIRIARIGIIVESPIDKTFENNLIGKVSINNYADSDEKGVSWVSHDIIKDSISINVMHNVKVNHNVQEIIPYIGSFSIDANTNIGVKLYEENISIIDVAGALLDEIEEHFKNEL